MPATEICEQCNAEITAFEQAYLLNGKVVCQLCDQRLRRTESPQSDGTILPSELKLLEEQDVAIPEMPVFLPDHIEDRFDLDQARKKRKLYLIFFVFLLISRAITLATPFGVVLQLPLLIFFLIHFLSSVKCILGYSTGKRVAIGIGIFIPLVSFVILAWLDYEMYHRIRKIERPVTPGYQGPKSFCSMGLYSLLLFPFPYAGLPLAIWAMRRIKKSDGRLYGRKLAVISLAVNAFFLLITFLMVLGAVFGDSPH